MNRIDSRTIARIIREAIGEISAYHGTLADFDRFNHRKYLNTGCESQTFGWGTYVTDDAAIGRSYAESAGYSKEDAAERGDEIWERINGITDRYTCEWLARECDYYNNPSNLSDRHIIMDIIEQCRKNINIGRKCLNNTYDNYVNINMKRLSLLTDIILPMAYTPSNGLIYTVEIPENDGTNYLDWDREMTPNDKVRIFRGLASVSRKYLDMAASNDISFRDDVYPYIISDNAEGRERVFSYMASEGCMFDSYSGGNMYNWLLRAFKSKKAVSLFLLNCCGYIGITYEAGRYWCKPKGSSDDARNYVLFNAGDVRIVKKERA